jgi:ribosome-binding factor A
VSRRAPSEGLVPAAAESGRGVARHKRVEAQLYEEIVMAIGDLGDPRVVGASVTSARLSADLRLATVFVHLGGDPDEGARRGLLAGLRSARGRLRRVLGETLSLRFTPDLRFAYDESPDRACRVERLLAEIRDRQGS